MSADFFLNKWKKDDSKDFTVHNILELKFIVAATVFTFQKRIQ